MQEPTPEQMMLLIGTSLFAVVFFIAVSGGIIFFFRRAEQGDRDETEKFSEASGESKPDVTKGQ